MSDRPVMQPSAWASLSGFTLTASIDLPMDATVSGARADGADLDLTYAQAWGRLTIAPTIETYIAGDPSDPDDRNTTEASLMVSRKVGGSRFFTDHTLDLHAYRGAYVGTAGISHDVALGARGLLTAETFLGWASSKFNEAYIGLRESAVNFIGAEFALTYALPFHLYARTHVEYSDTLDARLRALLERPTATTVGLGIGVEF